LGTPGALGALSVLVFLEHSRRSWDKGIFPDAFAKTPDFVNLQQIHNPLNITTILASIHHDSSNAELEIFTTFNEGAERANRDS